MAQLIVAYIAYTIHLKCYLYFMKLALVAYLSCSCLLLKAQSVEQYSKKYHSFQRNGMYILTGFAGVNMIASSFSLSTSNNVNKSFHQMNIGWNGINILLGVVGLRKAYQAKPFTDKLEALKKGKKMETLFLVNTTLDIAYIVGGALVKETRYRNTEQWNQLTGWGNAIMYNGVFLFAFDGVMYALHKQHNQKLWAHLQAVEVGYSPNGFRCIVKF